MHKDNLLNHPYVIAAFAVVVFIMLLLDLGVFNKKPHAISTKEALTWSLVWIGLAMGFSGVIFAIMGVQSFAEFQSAYWIEKALSVDNLFVFILVFNFFEVPEKAQHKVLFWGVLGAIIMRAIFIFTGVEIISNTFLPPMTVLGKVIHINYVLVLFGLFLLYASYKSWFSKEEDEEDYSSNFAAKIVRKILPISDTYDGTKFFTVKDGIKMGTPLLLVVAVIEFTDLLFAVDSIPAIFAISKDSFILYTSNIFAILGLRALFFILANFMHKFSRLKYGLAIILAFIGLKMISEPILHIDPVISLAIVGSILLISTVLSIYFPIENHEKN